MTIIKFVASLRMEKFCGSFSMIIIGGESLPIEVAGGHIGSGAGQSK